MASRGLRGPDRPRLRGRAVARAPWTPRRSAPRRATRPARCSGATKPESRSCPVVLSERVTASFAGFIGGALCADEVQRGRSPVRRPARRRARLAGVRARRRRHRSGRARQRALRRRGDAARADAPDRRRKLLAYLHDSYTARRGGARSTGNASRASYRSPPSVSTSNLVLEPGRARRSQGLLGQAGDGVYITEVAGLHSGVNPVTGRYSVGRVRAGRSAVASWPSRCASSRSPATCSARWRPCSAVGSETRWVPVRRLGADGADAGRRDGDRRRLVWLQQSLLGSARTPIRGGDDVTKAEFLDVLARDSRIGNKKEAGQAVDAVLDAITDVLQGGGEVSFTGFGKFAVAERGPRQGVNPRTGRADLHPRRQGAPVLRRLRAEEEGQGRLGRLTGARSPTGWRRSSTSAAARCAWGSTRIRRCFPRTPRPDADLTDVAERAAAAVVEHCRRADRARRPRLRRGEATARLLREARRTRLAGAGGGLRGGAAGRAAGGRRRQARRRAGDRQAYGQALVGETRDAVGVGSRPGRRRLHRQPAARGGRDRAAGRGRRGRRRGRLPAGADLEPRRRAAAGRAARRPSAARGARRAGRGGRSAARGRVRALGAGRGGGRHGAAAPRRGCAS